MDLAYKYRNSNESPGMIERYRTQQRKDRAHNREMEKLETKNKAAKELQQTKNKGTLKETKAEQQAATNRAKLRSKQAQKQFEDRQNLRQKKFSEKQRQNLIKQFNRLTTDQVDETTGKVISKGLSDENAIKRMMGLQTALNKNFGSALRRGMAEGSGNTDYNSNEPNQGAKKQVGSGNREDSKVFDKERNLESVKPKFITESELVGRRKKDKNWGTTNLQDRRLGGYSLDQIRDWYTKVPKR